MNSFPQLYALLYQTFAYNEVYSCYSIFHLIFSLFPQLITIEEILPHIIY